MAFAVLVFTGTVDGREDLDVDVFPAVGRRKENLGSSSIDFVVLLAVGGEGEGGVVRSLGEGGTGGLGPCNWKVGGIVEVLSFDCVGTPDCVLIKGGVSGGAFTELAGCCWLSGRFAVNLLGGRFGLTKTPNGFLWQSGSLTSLCPFS